MKSPFFSANRKLARERQLRKLAAMRAAKERKRMAQPREPDPRMIRFYPLEFRVHNKLTGEVSDWHDIRSARHIAKQISLLLKYFT